MNFIERNLRNGNICKELIRRAKSFFWKMGVNIQQDREDLTMKVLTIMLKRGPDFRGDTLDELRAFFYGICKRVFLNQLRRLLRERKILINTDNLRNTPNHTGNSTEEIYIRKETTEIVYNAINQLRHPSRPAIKLILKKNSYKEIAEILGHSLSNVKVIIHKDKKRLKKILESRGKKWI